MKTLQLSILALGFVCLVEGQLTQKRPDPVPILKQISKQNDDGSYSYGYEAGDGSYKIETKFTDGEVQGKYGYVDDEGKLREIEYGATSKEGFRPQGNGINIPPPPAANDIKYPPLADGEEDDGQYREDPSIYDTKQYKASLPAQKASRPKYQSAPPLRIFQETSQPAEQTYRQAAEQTYRQPAQQTYRQPAQQTYSQPAPAPVYRKPSQTFSFSSPFFQQYQQPSQNLDYEEPQQQYYQRPTGLSFQQPSAGRFFNNYQQPQPQPQPQPQYQTYTQPQYQSYQQPQTSGFSFHPSVRNYDIGTGSYSINYSGR